MTHPRGSEKARRSLSDGVAVRWRPPAAELEVLSALLAPWRALTDPVFFGLEHVPANGAGVLVGNHSIFGLLDLPLMIDGIRRERGRFVRGLAEHAHFAVPAWREMLVRFGAVRGTRDNCRALLAAGEAVLVYPGGGREVAKRKGEAYQLIWKQRMGFARMAIEAGCPIVPVSDRKLFAGNIFRAPNRGRPRSDHAGEQRSYDDRGTHNNEDAPGSSGFS